MLLREQKYCTDLHPSVYSTVAQTTDSARNIRYFARSYVPCLKTSF